MAWKTRGRINSVAFSFFMHQDLDKMDNLTSDEQRAVSLLVSAFEVIRRNQPPDNQDPGYQSEQISRSSALAGAAASSSTSRSGGPELVIQTSVPTTSLTSSGETGSSPSGDSSLRQIPPRCGGYAFNPSRGSTESASGSRLGGFAFTPSSFIGRGSQNSFRLGAQNGSVSRPGLREMRELFSPYPDVRNSRRPNSRSRNPRVTSRKFLCLPSPIVTKVPTSAQKSILLEYKLGEKSVQTQVGATSEQLIADIKSAYPKLSDTDFELMRSHGHARKRSLHRINDTQNVPSLPEINALRLGVCIIRPLAAIITDQEMTRYMDPSEISESNSRNTVRIDSFVAANSTPDSMSGTDDELLDLSDPEGVEVEGNRANGPENQQTEGSGIVLRTDEASQCDRSFDHQEESNRDPSIDLSSIERNGVVDGHVGHQEEALQHPSVLPRLTELHLERRESSAPIRGNNLGAVGSTNNESFRDPGTVPSNIQITSNRNTPPEPSPSRVFPSHNPGRCQLGSNLEDYNTGTMIMGDNVDIYDCPTFDELRTRIQSQSSETQYISVDRRDNFFDQVVGLYMKDTSLNLKLKPQVKFYREPAHDHGGVTREFFECCLAALPTFRLQGRYALFEGDTNHLLPSTDSAILRSGVFYAIGKLMAHSLINTGIAAYGLAFPFVQYLVAPNVDALTPFTITALDIPDIQLRQALEVIDTKWTNEAYVFDEEEQAILFEASAAVGFNGEISFSNRGLIKEVISLHSVIDTRRSQMEEVKKAFQDLGLVHFLHEREYLWPSAFPSNDDNKCPASLLKKHILYEGENSERVKVMLENIIDEYSADEREKLLIYWQSWRQLIPEQNLHVHVGRHEFAVHTCTNTLDIPVDMTEDQIKGTLHVLINTIGFTAV